MRNKDICGYGFTFVQNLLPALDENKQVIKYRPQDKFERKNTTSLNPYGEGDFCQFSVDNCPFEKGVYAFVANDEVLYVGCSVDILRQMNSGFGSIQPINCYEGGQPTNCKLNKVVWEHYEKGFPVELYVYQTEDHTEVKKEILRKIQTKYNDR